MPLFSGPVFVEFPIDTLYQYDLVKREIGMKDKGPTSLMQRVVNWYLNNHLSNLFAGAWEPRDCSPLPVDIPKASSSQSENIFAFQLPVIIISMKSRYWLSKENAERLIFENSHETLETKVLGNKLSSDSKI